MAIAFSILLQILPLFLGIDANCGGDVIQEKGILHSPNYPEVYPKNKECTWRITVPENYQVVLKFRSFELEHEDTCRYDYLEIRDGHESTSPVLGRFCGSGIPEDIRSSGNKMTVKFASDGGTETRGFAADFMKADLDECKGDHGCEHECTNTLGAYKCECRSGYKLQSDGKKCEVDEDCLNPDAFKCSRNSCILPEKLCDGKKDCENGLDEENCDFAAYSAAYLKDSLENATEWMRRQRNADWGWKGNTHRAVVALHLDQDLNFYNTVNEDELIAKQLELEVSTYLLRNEDDKIRPTELSAYINALLVICHNPRNFYGFDLVLKLKEEMEKVPGYEAPLPYLTLCNAKENIPEEAVYRLLEALERSSDLGFILEVQALSIMALSCISDSAQYLHLKQNVTEFSNDLKKEQSEDGSFGNEYTTALVLQALIANNQTDDKDWNSISAVEFLRQKQNADGSFGDFLTTYLVMPTLNAKSLVDVGKVNCTEQLKRPKEGNLISDIKSRLGGKVAVKYSLFIGDEKDQIHPIVLRTPENITVIELMTLAADIDPKYKFKTHQIKKKTYVYEISGIPNDPESNKFWFLYRDNDNGTIPISTQSPDEIRVSENDHIIMWYKALNMM